MNEKIICCELISNLLQVRWGYDDGGIEDYKNDRPEKGVFLSSSQKWIKDFSEDKEMKGNKWDWLCYAALHGQFDKLCENCQNAFKKFEELSKKSWESPENQKIIAYSLSNKELLQEVQRRSRNKKINLAYDEGNFVGLIAKNDDYFCEFSCCVDVYWKEFSISAYKNPSWPESGMRELFREGVQWEATIKDWKDISSLPLRSSKSNQEHFKWLEKVRKELLEAWAENKKEHKDYEMLEEIEKKIKSREFTKHEPELQNAFKKVREQLKKQTKEWEKKFAESLSKKKRQKEK